ncbi:MFS general substrate transporter [Amniculicola lignicola CBS 123094]|uniref:MFS general substrate transporter n=1 Tax=Amniculicola lignicola CBS 123094 TaxID=1392246 RepID=A0A6A5W566_9PLEO|nr:MFS general substrate transporter [Amniculicola lignicola CBS 123094]
MAPNNIKDPAAFPTKQLIVLGICRFSEPIAFNSILAYSYDMVQDLGISELDAPFYAGLLVSAYALAEACTALGWGAVSDVYGRKPVALIGLVGVAISSLIFGMAKTYWVALLARLIGGALNGNVAVMQTMVQEMVKNPAHEPKAYATQPFVWTLGGIIGSAMGGYLAQPAHYYPTVFSKDGIFGRYPYLLPNLVAVVCILLAILQGVFFLEETSPAYQQQQQDHQHAISDEIDETTPLRRPRNRASFIRESHTSFRSRSRSVINSIRDVREEIRARRPSFLEESMPLPIAPAFDIRRTSFGTMHSIRLPNDNIHHPFRRADASHTPRKTFNYTVVQITVVLVLLAYHQMSYITNLPVYLQQKRDPHNPNSTGLDLVGGLGYQLPDVGTFLAVNGFIALFIQAVIFPWFVNIMGVWYSFVSMIVLYPTCYLIIPFFSALPPSLVTPSIYFSLCLQSFYAIIVFPCALILLKNATPSPLVLGRVNGMAMSATCLARTVGPPLVGIIYAIGGSAASWFSLAIVAIIGVFQLFWVPREDGVGHVEVESGLKSAMHHNDHGDIESIHESVFEE